MPVPISRRFAVALLLATLAGFVLRMYVGSRAVIDFDEWQHAFMASSSRWADLWFELRTNAHPPLFFLLLHGIVRLGRIEFYRVISIAAGVGSIAAAGVIAARIFRSQLLALLCAAALALSTNAITVSTEIRSYQLAVFFMMVAFLAMVPLVDTTSIEEVSGVSCIAFSLFTSLALLTHYSAVFFLGACVVLMLPRVRDPRIAIALALPCLIFSVEYFVHAGSLPPQGYLRVFYLGGVRNESAGGFLLRNSFHFLNLFLPAELETEWPVPLIFVLICFLATLGIRRHARIKAIVLFPFLILLEIIAASMFRKYPFGGLLRHQYVVIPFFLIAAFAVLDALVPVGRRALLYAVSAIALAGSVASLVIQWESLVSGAGEPLLLTDEFRDFRSRFPHPSGVYVDHWGVIAYFIHSSDQPQRFLQRIADGAVVDEYETPDGTRIFYDKTHFRMDFADVSVYQSFEACLRQSGVPDVTLFYFSPDDVPFNRSARSIESTVRQLAASQGLATLGVSSTPTTLFARFALAGQ